MKTTLRDQILRSTALVLASTMFVGCQTARDHSLTYKLWHNDELRHFAEPAADPKLTLHAMPGKTSVLVEYDEVSEQNDKRQRRAYFLDQNYLRVQEHQKPEFVESTLAHGMQPIPMASKPILPAAARPVPDVFAVTNSDAHSFTIYRGEQINGPHSLPVYEAASGNVAKAALTPFAVAGDAVMVGVVSAVAGFFSWASGMIAVQGR